MLRSSPNWTAAVLQPGYPVILSMSDRNLNHLYPPFRTKIEAVIADFNAWTSAHHPGWDIALVEGYRTAEYQHSLYEQGRTKPGKIVTYKDGYRHPSNHQSSLAADLCPRHNGKFDFDPPKEFWAYLGHCCRAHGLKWGGDWNSFKDIDHLEWDTADRQTYADAGKWQNSVGL